MNISIGMNLQRGPFGGGNQFGNALVKSLEASGHRVTFNLQAYDLDLILLAEPRSNLQISAYSDAHIWQYVKLLNPHGLVIHRINECDERKGTTGVNKRIIAANRVADHTVFVSDWLRDLYLEQGIGSRAFSVIRNGSDRAIFHADGYREWDGQSPLKIVTHHWGGHWLKGFDVYQQLDEWLADTTFSDRFSFTYIGNIPDGFTFKHAKHIKPLSGTALADAIREHHVYITGSQNEPGPNHQNEGANCGLPLLYRPSGGLTEYCEGYGIAFSMSTLREALDKMRQEYHQWREHIQHYPYNAENTMRQYQALFADMQKRYENLVATRAWQADPTWKRLARQLKRKLIP